MIQALLDPVVYPEPTVKVELKQTHISFLFLTDDFVYKIKKPVDFGFLDFTSLDKRLHYCKEEARLNQRLAKGVYLGIVKITQANGAYRVEGQGEAVEYAVKMKRVPEEAMLNRAISEERINAPVMERVAKRIADFHASAEQGPEISPYGSPELIRKNWDENFSQTLDHRGSTISFGSFDGIKDYVENFLLANDALFKKRVESGLIRDCHGDIHSDHVAITDHIDIIDCIEFNERFRYSDIISDAAFLSMDLEFQGRGDLARVFERAYLSATKDLEGQALLDFYKCYRACVRGKVESLKASESEVEENERRDATRRAMRLFHLALLYARGGFKPMLLIVCGLSGAGKTALSVAISKELGALRFSSDRVRKGLVGLDPFSRATEKFGQGIYTPEFTEKTYKELIGRAEMELKKGRPVVVDATFSKKRFLDMAAQAAENAGAELRIILCTAPDEVLRQRIEKRSREKRETDATWEICVAQKKSFESMERPHFQLDTDAPMARLLDALFKEVYLAE
jgi:hypothetical protein